MIALFIILLIYIIALIVLNWDDFKLGTIDILFRLSMMMLGAAFTAAMLLVAIHYYG